MAPQLAFEPGSYDFGLHEVNRENSQNYFQLRNVGSVPAPIYSLEIIGSGSGAFGTGNSDCFGRTLEPGETCSVQVSFNPYNVAEFSAQLRATSTEGTSFTAGLSGGGGRPVLTAATNPTNFGSLPVGSAGVTRTIDVTNEGNMPGGAFSRSSPAAPSAASTCSTRTAPASHSAPTRPATCRSASTRSAPAPRRRASSSSATVMAAPRSA